MGTPNQILLDRIRGCMVGAVLGDCLGSPVECTYWYGIKKKSVRKHFDAYKKEGSKLGRTGPLMKYTDDTAMARQVALSIIDKKELDAKDLAKRFVKLSTWVWWISLLDAKSSSGLFLCTVILVR